MLIEKPRFTADDAESAHDGWGANCGPGALAAICGLTLDEVRPHMGDFERKGYTNPTLMKDALRRVVDAGKIKSWFGVSGPDGDRTLGWPRYGLARIQWEGPWTKPGVPARVAYRHTHWVGACADNPRDIGIFDINAIANGMGWVELSIWESILVPWITQNCVPRADGKWHITHSIEVRR